MLARSVAFPMFRKDRVGANADQKAMQIVVNETAFAPAVVYVPRLWFNVYEKKREVKPGDMLMHFPGRRARREVLMTEWLDKYDLNPEMWEIDLANTTYPARVAQFWSLLRLGRDTAIA